MNRGNRIGTFVTLLGFVLFSVFAFGGVAIGDLLEIPKNPKTPPPRCTNSPYYSIQGTVTEHIADKTSGANIPVAGVVVKAITPNVPFTYCPTTQTRTVQDGRVVYSTTASASGYFTLRLPRNTSIDLEFSKAGYPRESYSGPSSFLRLNGDINDKWTLPSLTYGSSAEPMFASSVPTMQGNVQGTTGDPERHPVSEFRLLIEGDNSDRDHVYDAADEEEREVYVTGGVIDYNITAPFADMEYLVTIYGAPQHDDNTNPANLIVIPQAGITRDWVVNKTDNPVTWSISLPEPLPAVSENGTFSPAFTVSVTEPDDWQAIHLEPASMPSYLTWAVTSGSQGQLGGTLTITITGSNGGLIPYNAIFHPTLSTPFSLTFDASHDGVTPLPGSPTRNGTVNDVDRGLTITRADISVGQGATLDFNATANDPDAEDIINSFTLDSGPTFLSINGSATFGNPATLPLRAAPGPSEPEAPHPVSLSADNNFAGPPNPARVPHSFTLTVSNEEFVPVVTSYSPADERPDPGIQVFVNQDVATTFQVTAEDSDLDQTLTFTWNLDGGATERTFACNAPRAAAACTDSFQRTFSGAEGGAHTLDVSITDGVNPAVPLAFNITVRVAPVVTITANPDPVGEGDMLTVTADILDADSPSVFHSIDNYPSDWMTVSTETISPSHKVVTFQGAPHFAVASAPAGQRTVTITAWDADGLQDVENKVLTVSESSFVYVDGSRTTGMLCNGWQGTRTNPFQTVQKAITAVTDGCTSPTGSAISGATVLPGVYEEGLVLDRNYTVRSEQGPEVTVLTSNPDDLSKSFAVHVRDATSGALYGFTIDARDMLTGLLITNTGSGFTVKNNIIRRGSTYGIQLMGTGTGGDALILNNLITENRYGIQVKHATSAPTLINNILTGNSVKAVALSTSGTIALADANIVSVGDTSLDAFEDALPPLLKKVAPADTFLVNNGDYHLALSAVAGLNDGNTATTNGTTDSDGTAIDRGPYGGRDNGVNYRWTDPTRMVARAGDDTAAAPSETASILDGSKSSYPNGYNAYTWKRGATTIGTGPRPSYTALAAPGTDTLTLEVTAGATTVSDTLDVAVRTLPASPNLFVDGTRPDDTGDGTTPGTAKKTIMAAMALARRGDIISVAEGAYNADTEGPFRIKEGVTLRAAELGLVIPNTSQTALIGTLSGGNGTVLQLQDFLTNTPTTIDGFTIGGNAAAIQGVSLYNTRNVRLLHNIVGGFSYVGIGLFRGDAEIRNNLLVHNAYTLPAGNPVGQFGYGISVLKARATVYNNTIDYTTNVGISLDRVDTGTEVRNNLITRSKYGFLCSEPAGTLSNNGVAGLTTVNDMGHWFSQCASPGTGNQTSADPAFFRYADPLTFPENSLYNYNLLAGSPAIDTGHTSAGNDPAPSPGPPDMGVYGGASAVGRQ